MANFWKSELNKTQLSLPVRRRCSKKATPGTRRPM